MTNFKNVKTFHKTFGLTVTNKPSLQPENIKELRKRLITEEYNELMEALDVKNDLHEIAKEAVDLLYVVYGLGVDYGIDMDKCFKEVQRSNMSKLTKEGKVLRREDGKVLKSDQYSPADLNPILVKAQRVGTRGRPRLHVDKAARQAAYRARKKEATLC